MLGRAVTFVLEQEFPGTISASRAEADVTDRFRLESEVERLRPDLVINCAAYTDVDGCETYRDRARRVNAEGAENAARAAAAAGCPIIHLSTDFVFDGRKSVPYAEDDLPAPLSEYGRTKLEGERRVVDDQFGSPTYVADLGRALRLLIQKSARGLVHFANAGACSRHALAQAILAVCDLSAVRLESMKTGEAGRIAVRPAYSALDTARYSGLTGEPPRPWQDALRDYLATARQRAADA